MPREFRSSDMKAKTLLKELYRVWGKGEKLNTS